MMDSHWFVAMKRDTRSQTVTLLKQLIEADGDDAREEELDYDEHGVTDAEISHVTVNAADDVRHGFTDGDQNSEQLLRPVQKRSVLLHALSTSMIFDPTRAGLPSQR